MVKVRESQIPEDSGKKQDAIPADDERKRLKKTVISFQEEGIVISAYDLHTIEKDMKFVEKPKAHWEWGIAINKGLESGQFVKKADIYMWYNSEEVRDEKYERLLKLLESEGLNIIEV